MSKKGERAQLFWWGSFAIALSFASLWFVDSFLLFFF